MANEKTKHTWVVTFDPVNQKITNVSFNGVDLKATRLQLVQDVGHPMILKLEFFVFNDEFKLIEKTQDDGK